MKPTIFIDPCPSPVNDLAALIDRLIRKSKKRKDQDKTKEQK